MSAAPSVSLKVQISCCVRHIPDSKFPTFCYQITSCSHECTKPVPKSSDSQNKAAKWLRLPEAKPSFECHVWSNSLNNSNNNEQIQKWWVMYHCPCGDWHHWMPCSNRLESYLFFFQETDASTHFIAYERYFATMQASLQFDIVLSKSNNSLQNRTSTTNMTFQNNLYYVICLPKEKLTND